MKKIVAFVSFLVLVIACATPSTNTNVGLETNRNSNSGAETTSAPITETTAIAQEKAAWDAIKNRQFDAFGQMLAPDQVEVGSEGVLDKPGTLNSVKEFEPTELTFADWKFMPVDKDLYLVTYTVTVKAKVQGKEMPPESVRASSAWVHRGSKWVALYHQSTPAVKPPPATASATKSPARTAEPVGSPAPVTTGPDAIANEKAIWDALKAKNLDGFASALANDVIQVNQSGVFDKAGTLEGLRQADFSKAELSEFKAVPIDSDANLVIYLAKFPAPDQPERHATIWAQRDGKWLAVFHQGTPVKPPATSASPAK